MKLRNLRAMTLGLMALALASCSDKQSPIQSGGDLTPAGEPQRFELGATMGEISLEPIANNTNPKVSEDDLRATLHFRNDAKWASTSYQWDDFGDYTTGKINARWGALLGTPETVDAKSCNTPLQNEPADGAVIPANSIWFNMGNSTTIDQKSLKMYCQSGTSFGANAGRYWMCLGGRPGSEAANDVNLSKQYFMLDDAHSDPNHEIMPLKMDDKQIGRNVPVMTDVRAYADFTKQGSEAKPRATFSPRGSLIGIIINNKLQREMRIESIIVRKGNNALDFSGYFDFKVPFSGINVKAKFTPEYPTSAGSLLEFNVNQTGEKHKIAPNLDDNKKHNDNPTIFYVWGIQNEYTKGEPLRLQIRYRSEFGGDPNMQLTTRTFRIYPGADKDNVTEFEDGKAYKTILDITTINQKGGSEGSEDWTEGDNINETTTLNALNPLALVAKYDIAKTYAIHHTTILKFVEKDKLKVSGGSPVTEYNSYATHRDVGFFTWAEAMRLFGYTAPDETAAEYYEAALDNNKWRVGESFGTLDKDQFKVRKYRNIEGQTYYLPNKMEMTAIIPAAIRENVSVSLQNFNTPERKTLQLVCFNNVWDNYLKPTPGVKTIGKAAVESIGGQTNKGLEDVQIGDVILRGTDYTDQYVTKEVNGSWITYAIRFKGTKFESAWSYEYKEATPADGGSRLIIKNVMLTKNSGKRLDGVHSIAKPEFFSRHNAIERVFPFYGYIYMKYNAYGGVTLKSTILEQGNLVNHWTTSLFDTVDSFSSSLNTSYVVTSVGHRNHGFPLRPFVKN